MAIKTTEELMSLYKAGGEKPLTFEQISTTPTITQRVPITVPSVVTSNDLTNQTTPEISPPKPSEFNFDSIMKANNAVISANASNLQPPQQPAPATPPEQQTPSTTDILSKYFDIQTPDYQTMYKTGYDQSEIGQRKQDVITQAEATNVAQQKYDAIQAQLQGLNMEAQNVPNKIQEDVLQRGITTAAGAAPLQASELRKIALRALPLQGQAILAQADLARSQNKLQFAQNLLQQAQETFNKFYEIQVKDAETKYNRNISILDKFYDIASAKEKERIDERKSLLASNKSQFDNFVSDIRSYAEEARKNGQADVGGKIDLLLNQIDPNSKTFAEDYRKVNTELSKLSSQIIVKPAIKQAVGVTQADDEQTIKTYTDLLASGKISLANVPQNIRNAVVGATGGIINKPLSDTAIKDIQQSESAVANLNALKAIVQNNLQYVGPISGLARFNPYSKARQVQAEIDRVRQQVGKTLEGGVLRKEDEEKYKKILATLADTPETAIYKIDSLIDSIKRDVETYKNLQSETGRFVGGLTGKNTTKIEDLRAKYKY